MITRLEITDRPDRIDSRGDQAARRIRAHLGIPVERVRTCDVYHVEARLEEGEAEKVLRELVDPVLQVGALGRIDPPDFDVAVSVSYLPGVTDPVGKSALVAVADTLGRPLEPDAAVYSSRVFLLQGVDVPQAERIAAALLANPVIQRIEVEAREGWIASEPDLRVPRVEARPTPRVEKIDLDPYSPEELAALSRKRLWILTADEMVAIREHFRAAASDGRPTDGEMECLAQTWSEHCKHKIFGATIRYREGDGPTETITSLFREYIKDSTAAIDRELRERTGRSWLISVFHDNAGVVAFDEESHLVFKVETHNSPSALDPYGGAITGIVGVNRDPFGTGLGSDLLANVWGYCFASPGHDGPLPAGLLHPRRIRDGVHEGVIDGGNQSGVPYARGWEVFDERYLGKPLVFCGTVGRLPVEIAGGPGEKKGARPGDRIVMTGGRIGADGIHGATFSSEALDESAPVQAVQIGDPITQKRMFDFLLEARAEGLYTAITDNGAGGLSSSVGEMATACGGARLDLSGAPLKYEGLAPWEILLSEAQERMTLAVAPDKLDRLLELARQREVEASDLGEFTDSGRFHVTHGEETVADISLDFLHDGLPEMRLDAVWNPPRFEEPAERETPAPGATLLEMVARLNVASGEAKARHYDQEVKGLTAVKPWVGAHRDVPSEASVFLGSHRSTRGFVLSEGVNPFYSDLDTHAMAGVVVDLAVRRQLCAGASLDRIALLDNFCWPDPVRSERTPDGEYKLAQLVRACRGLAEAVLAYRAPLVSGKDSMKNDSTMGGVKISVPPTLLVSAMGQIDDVRRALTLELRAPGDVVFALGVTRDELGGSEYYRHLGEKQNVPRAPGAPAPWVGRDVPRLNPEETLPLYRALEAETKAGRVRSASAPALGGWALAAVRSALAGDLGLDIELVFDDLDTAAALYSESAGRFLVTTKPGDADRFEETFAGLACRRIGVVREAPRLRIDLGSSAFEVGLAELRRAFREALRDD